MPLFMRSRRGLTLTHAGTVYRREIVPSLRQLERANRLLADSSSSRFRRDRSLPLAKKLAVGLADDTLSNSSNGTRSMAVLASATTASRRQPLDDCRVAGTSSTNC